MTGRAGWRRRELLAAGIALAWCGTLRPAAAQDFTSWLAGLRSEALGKGISARTLDVALAGVQPIPRVLELDRNQPEFTLTFQEYLARVVTDRRVTDGREYLDQYKVELAAVTKRFGVPPQMVVALWAIESDYGQKIGDFNVIAALATLAYEGRRAEFFRGELLNALKIIDKKHIKPAEMVGSWAGAMGMSQFMPSSFLAYAVDFDGDGKADIWNSPGDVFASIANYLAHAKWRPGETWGRAVMLPAKFDTSQADLSITRPALDWTSLGVHLPGGAALPTNPATGSIVLPAGDATPAYLVYDNYRAIMRWNRSLYFATAVGLLADRLAAG